MTIRNRKLVLWNRCLLRRRGIDALKGLSAMARTPMYKTMAPGRNVTDVVIFRMSKDCRSELAIFGRRTPLVAEAQ